MDTRYCVIIPFYNEELRLNLDNLEQLLLQDPLLQILMVDDASDDMLAENVKKRFKNNSRVNVINTFKRSGKAEALRMGIRSLPLNSLDFVGFTDADFSAPPSEIIKVFKFASDAQADLVHAIRFETKNNLIKTNLFRRRQGAFFQFLVSVTLKLKTKDSQCGLKVYNSVLLETINLEIPFQNPWLFDLELLLRIPRKSACKAIEYTLDQWIHKTQSKVNLKSVIYVPLHLLQLRFTYGTLQTLNFTSQ